MRTRAHEGDEAPLEADRELLRQIDERAPDHEAVSAVFRLRTRRKSELALPPKETEAAAKQVLKRVARSVGAPPDRYNVFHNLGAFAVSAKPSFLRELIAQPEIQAAMANRPRRDVLSRPVEAKRVVRKRRKKSSRQSRSSRGSH
jgi:hypothetical protein